MKRITKENWLQLAEEVEPWVTYRDGKRRRVTALDWIEDAAAPQLTEQVPKEVRELFETCRGCLVYGALFYPLYALGQEQLSRTAEAAARHACQRCGAQLPSNHSFDTALKWLRSRGRLDDEAYRWWDFARQDRNAFSHPHSQRLTLPTHAIADLAKFADRINALFAGIDSSGRTSPGS